MVALDKSITCDTHHTMQYLTYRTKNVFFLSCLSCNKLDMKKLNQLLLTKTLATSTYLQIGIFKRATLAEHPKEQWKFQKQGAKLVTKIC